MRESMLITVPEKWTKRRNAGLCPVCGKHMVPFIGFKAGMIYECKNCGYRGPLTITKKVKK